MVTIAIHTEETILKALKEIAEQKQTTLEDITQEALRQYLQSQISSSQVYSLASATAAKVISPPRLKRR